MSNHEFQDKYLTKDNLLIAKKVALYFSDLDKDDIDSETMVCLWEASVKFDPNKHVKFTTYFFSYLYWKLFEVRRKNNLYIKNKIATKSDQYYADQYSLLDDILPTELSNLLRQRYLDKMTLKEIGNANGYCAETARANIKKAISILRDGV